MPEIFEKVSLFFDRIKSATFWDRVLPWRWRIIRTLSYEAYSEYKQLVESLHQNVGELEQGRTSIATLRQENEQLKINSAKLEKDMTTKQNEITRLQVKIEGISHEAAQLKEEIAGLKESEANLLKQYENKTGTLDRIQNRIEEERKQEEEERHRLEIQRITSMKDNWARHQETVKETIKGICQRHVIEYVEKPPFKGNPDNTIKICDEFVVFDAKSPGTEDLKVFYKYIKKQAEDMKKYAKQESVKRDVFLVVPSNTIDAIEQFSFNMGDYKVYVVTVDSLEPLILALRKVEEYEFAEELTPEERENVCRIIGKFAHTAKRRIQIDHFFQRQFLDVLIKCESDVPSDMLEKAVDFERAEKLNPPQERRTKQLPSKELVKETEKIRREAEAKDVVFPEAIQEGIKALPLYEEEQSTEQNQGKTSD
jgi:hypothetical protein